MSYLRKNQTVTNFVIYTHLVRFISSPDMYMYIPGPHIGFVVTLNIWRLPAANESELVEDS